MNYISCPRFRFLLSLVLLFLSAFLPAVADVVKGRFVDAQTREPLPEVVARVVQEYDNCTRFSTFGVDSLGRFTVQISGDNCRLEAGLVGYHPLKRSFMAGPTMDTLDLGDLALRPSDVFLKSAVVTARAKRFVMRGDTVVFNPEAFYLEEGARLDDLIKQLPGVTQRDGKLYWMDKPVRVLMNGEEMFADNSLLVNRLPAEAVERIKAYNKGSEQKRQSGRDDGDEDYVLDIAVKPGFLDRWYGDAQAAYQTSEGYLARLDTYYLSTHDPLMAFLNWENINRNYFMKTFDATGLGSTDPYGKQLFGSVGYKRQWKRKQGDKPLKSYVAVSASAGHNDDWGSQESSRETLLPDAASTFGLAATHTDKHSVNPSFDATAWLQLDSVTHIRANFSLGYERSDRLQTERSAVYDSNPFDRSDAPLDAAFDDADASGTAVVPVTRASYRETRRRKHFGTKLWASLFHYFRDKSELSAGLSLGHTDERSDALSHRDIRYFREDGREDRSTELGRAPWHELTVGAHAAYSKWWGRHVLLKARYEYSRSDGLWKEDRFRLHLLPGYDESDPIPAELPDGVRDAANSYRRDRTEDVHRATLSGTINLRSVTLMPSFEMKRTREALAYRRGVVDTAVVDRKTIWTPAITARWKISRSLAVEADWSYRTDEADLLNTIGYVDDTDPLMVTRGNPLLDDGHVHAASLKLVGNSVKHQRSFTAKVGWQRTSSPISSVYLYNAETGGYTTTWANVRGGNTWTGSLAYEQAAGDYVRLRNECSVSSGTAYGFLAATAAADEFRLERSHDLRFVGKPRVSFENDKASLSLSGVYELRCRESSSSAAHDDRLTDYEVALEAGRKWRQFTFSTGLELRGYRGYAMSAMNKCRPVWSASVDWKVLRGKGLLRLELDDILNRNKWYWCEATANEREEMQQETIHHYAHLSFTYHFDAKKTKEGREREKRRRSLDF